MASFPIWNGVGTALQTERVGESEALIKFFALHYGVLLLSRPYSFSTAMGRGYTVETTIAPNSAPSEAQKVGFDQEWWDDIEIPEEYAG